MFKVRSRKYESKNWKVIAEFESEKEAKIFAVKLDMKWRKNIETMYDHIDIKYPDGSRFIVA